MLEDDDAGGAVGGSCDDSEASARPFSFAKVRVWWATAVCFIGVMTPDDPLADAPVHFGD